MRRHVIAVVALLVGSMAGAIVHAQIYKWTDEEGNVHFGDRPEDADTASDAEEVDLELNYQPPQRTPAEIETLNAQWRAQAEARQRREAVAEQEKAEQLAADEKQKMAKCRALDDVINTYGSAKRVNGRLRITYVEDADGQPISEEAQREGVEELRRQREALGCP